MVGLARNCTIYGCLRVTISSREPEDVVFEINATISNFVGKYYTFYTLLEIVDI